MEYAEKPANSLIVADGDEDARYFSDREENSAYLFILNYSGILLAIRLECSNVWRKRTGFCR